MHFFVFREREREREMDILDFVYNVDGKDVISILTPVFVGLPLLYLAIRADRYVCSSCSIQDTGKLHTHTDLTKQRGYL